MNKKTILGLVIVVFLFTSLLGALYLVGTRQKTTTQAAPSTTISLTPSRVSLNPGDSVEIYVDINPSGGNLIGNVSVKIDYPEQDFTYVSFDNNPDVMGQILSPGVVHDEDLGTIFIDLGRSPSQDLLETPGRIATLTLQVKQDATAGEKDITFIRSSTIAYSGAEEDSGINVIMQSGYNDTSVAITQAQASPSPSLSPSPSPSPGDDGGDDDGDDDGGASPSPSPSARAIPLPSTLPDTGITGPTNIIILAGSLLLILGFLALVI